MLLFWQHTGSRRVAAARDDGKNPVISVMVTDQPQLEEKENNSDFVVVKIPESESGFDA